ncbi:carboxymuconolactone decarboxylase family protein [Actinomadura welshii]|uniref:carboxymuconolactone decarboxylase family protein n=1 Tax=Actinomadura welshii TaxID=3103817 RepID=UPI0003AD4692|nr:carboxymuconolactone decarboxylase family protein [Actinomadura madurae]
MARVPEAAGTGEIADRIRHRRAGGVLRPLDHVLLHAPHAADGWNSLLGALRAGEFLPADLRELAILRVAVLNDAAYEWDAHLPDAAAAGLGPAQLAQLRIAGGKGADVFTPLQAAALRLTDAMTRDLRVPDDLFADLRARLGVGALVELAVVIAAYNMVSRLIVALGITSTDGAS